MHNAALRAFGLPHSYERWPTPRAQLQQRVEQLRQPGMRGANVTLPHKVAVLEYLDAVDPAAAALGAVNTLVHSATGTLTGYNTDAPALRDSLAACGWHGGHAVVLGAGGAARAAMVALRQLQAAQISVVNRTIERAQVLVEQPNEAAVSADDHTLPTLISTASLVINATALGWHASDPAPLAGHLLHANLIVYDMVYRPTPLLEQARRCGAQAIDGLDMLVRQAALAFALWFPGYAALHVMRSAAEQALGRNP